MEAFRTFGSRSDGMASWFLHWMVALIVLAFFHEGTKGVHDNSEDSSSVFESGLNLSNAAGPTGRKGGEG